MSCDALQVKDFTGKPKKLKFLKYITGQRKLSHEYYLGCPKALT